MRCKICDTLLSDSEAVATDDLTGDFLDICGVCLEIIRLLIDDYEEKEKRAGGEDISTPPTLES